MKEYIRYLDKRRNRAATTLKQYSCILREFAPFEPVTSSSFDRYQDKIRHNKPGTIKTKLTIVKSYLNWKADNGMKVTQRFWNDAEAPRYRRLPKALEVDEVKRILAVTDDPYWRAFFSFLFNTGARISELLTLEQKQISTNGTTATIYFIGKGNKERVITVSKPIVEDAINAGLFERRVSVSGAGKALKRYAKKAGITKNVYPHVLRHSFSVALVTSGTPINQLQKLLGHSNIATTGVYLDIASESVKIPRLA